MNHLITIVTFSLVVILTACETINPGDNPDDDPGNDSIPTFTYRIVDTGVGACYNNHQGALFID